MTTVIAKSRTISNGQSGDATPVENNFVELYQNDQTLATDLTTLQSGNTSISGNKTYSGTAAFSAAVTLSSTVNITGTGTLNLGRSSDPGSPVEGMFWADTTNHIPKFYNGTSILTLATTAFIPPSSKGHIWGLTLSNNAITPNTDVDIAAGQCMDDTNTDLMVYAGGTKRFSTAWIVGTGNGAIDTGAMPTSGTLHVFIIKRPDTGVVDLLCSTSLTPTMPASYTLKRRIASITTDASAHMMGFVQYGDRFEYTTPPSLDVNVNNQGTTAVTRTLSVPTGIRVEAILNVYITSTSGNVGLYIRNLDTADVGGTNLASPLNQVETENGAGGTRVGGAQVRVITSTSGQISTRATAASTTVEIATLGWIDTRGRVA